VKTCHQKPAIKPAIKPAMTSIAKLKKQWLKDPKVNEAFEKMRPEFLKRKRRIVTQKQNYETKIV